MILKIWVSIEEKLCMTILAINLILVFFSACARAVGYPNPWSVELAQTLFAWFAMSAVSITWRKNKHVNVDLVSRKFSPELTKAVTIINYILITCFLAALVVLSVKLSITSIDRYLLSIPITYSVITISVGIFSASMLQTTIARLIEMIRTPDYFKKVGE